MPADLVAVIAATLVTAAACALGPAVISRLPEPPPESASQPQAQPAAEPAAGSEDYDLGSERSEPVVGTGPDPGAKPRYADLASRPHLAGWLLGAGALAGAVIGWRIGADPVLAAWVYLGVVGVVLGYIDAQTRLLPTRIIAPSYAVVVVLLAVAAVADGDIDRIVRSALGWASFGGFYLLMWLVHPRGLGYGDVRLSGLLGLALGYVGWGQLVVGLYAGFLLGGIGGGALALLKVVDRRRYPFGPFMLLGALAGLIWGTAFDDRYLQL